MENSDIQLSYINELLTALTSDTPESIDFDKLIAWLKVQQTVIESYSDTVRQCRQLKEDLIGRVAGMVKAIAVTRKRPRDLSEALDFIDTLHRMDAQSLIENYKRVQARFHDTFPASFNVKPTPSRTRRRTPNNTQTRVGITARPAGDLPGFRELQSTRNL